jgi:exosortase
MTVQPDSALGALTTFVMFHWRILLLGLLVILLYGTVISELVKDWYKSGDNAHGFFVPAVSAYLIWRKRSVLSSLRSKPTNAGLGLIIGSLVLLFIGNFGAEWFLTRVSLVGTITGLVLYFKGWEKLRALAFPLGFLLLMIPLPGILYYQIVFPLQLLASRLAIFGLERLDLFPVIREGNLLFLPHYTLEVVEACSGVRSLMSLLTLALGYGYLADCSYPVRLASVLLVVPLAVLSNAFRVMVQAVIVRYRGLDIAEGSWHQLTGLLTFICAAFLLLLTLQTLSKFRKDRQATI